MKITVLTENTTELNFSVEHGLSLYIETGNRKILFDSGQSALFAENAAKLGIDLGKVDFAVLSHGHYDHGGGLKRFLEINAHAPVYMNRCAFEPHFNAEGKYIGLDKSLEDDSRIVLTGGVYKICEGAELYSCEGRKALFKTSAFGLKAERNGKIIEDDFCHEHYLMLEENGKKVLFSGCSHKGILNIVNWFKPDVLVGGFHFFKLPVGSELEHYTKLLAKTSVRYYTCHCTGEEQYRYMKTIMPQLRYISTGQSIEL